jgi:hypothetical protein
MGELFKRFKSRSAVFISDVLFPNIYFQNIFNRLNTGYKIYKRDNVIEGADFILYYVKKDGSVHYLKR